MKKKYFQRIFLVHKIRGQSFIVKSILQEKQHGRNFKIFTLRKELFMKLKIKLSKRQRKYSVENILFFCCICYLLYTVLWQLITYESDIFKFLRLIL